MLGAPTPLQCSPAGRGRSLVAHVAVSASLAERVPSEQDARPQDRPLLHSLQQRWSIV